MGKPLSAEHKAKISAALKGKSRGGVKARSSKSPLKRRPVLSAVAKAARERASKVKARRKLLRRKGGFNAAREIAKAVKGAKRNRVQR